MGYHFEVDEELAARIREQLPKPASRSSRKERTPEEHEKWKAYKREMERKRRERPDVLLKAYKSNCRQRRMEWRLDDEHAIALFKSPCHYCGENPAPLNGIDRKDNSLGYTESNSLPSCGRCNMMKKDLTYEGFLDHCSKIHYFKTERT